MKPFRGLTKDGDGKDFVYGWYCFVPEQEYTVTRGKETVSARHFIIDADKTEQCLDRCEDEYVYDISEAIEVIPESVAQQVGRQDKNGKDVYEGDSLRTPGGQILKVEISDLINGDGKFRSIVIEECELEEKSK